MTVLLHFLLKSLLNCLLLASRRISIRSGILVIEPILLLWLFLLVLLVHFGASVAPLCLLF